jgi:hypothetical protein
LQLGTLKKYGFETASEIDPEEGVDEDHVGEVEGEQSEGHPILHGAFEEEKDASEIGSVLGGVHGVGLDLEILGLIAIVDIYGLISYFSRKWTVEALNMEHLRRVVIAVQRPANVQHLLALQNLAPPHDLRVPSDLLAYIHYQPQLENVTALVHTR